MQYLDEKISVAPMMDITDRHWRYMLRGFSKRTVLYSEMVVDDTVNHNLQNLDYLIGRDIEEGPSVIQLGGYNPETLAEAAWACENVLKGGYSEINLNCGCPSDRVKKRCFGASLMLEPDLVREIVNQMQRRVSIPITVKCRLGVDNKDSYDELTTFIRSCVDGGSKKFILHSRKAILKGLSTKQNRDIPPLKYEVVHRLVKDFPDLTFVINGGILNFEQGCEHMESEYMYTPVEDPLGKDASVSLPPVHGVMIGRAAFNNPCIFAEADSRFYGCGDPLISRRQAVERYLEYCERALSATGPRKRSLDGQKEKEKAFSTPVLLKPLHNMMVGLQHNQKYRRALNDLYDEKVRECKGQGHIDPREIVEGAMLCLSDWELDQPLGLRARK